MFSVTLKILLLVGALRFMLVIKVLSPFDDMFISCPPKRTFQWNVFGTSMVSCTLAVQFSVNVLYGGVTKAVTVCGCTLTSTTGPVDEKQDGSNQKHATPNMHLDIICNTLPLYLQWKWHTPLFPRLLPAGTIISDRIYLPAGTIEGGNKMRAGSINSSLVRRAL